MDKIKIGVLALQGAFVEHQSILEKCGVDCVLVRTVNELESCDGLIIPGGESTTIARLAIECGLFDVIAQFIADDRPTWVCLYLLRCNKRGPVLD
jgi:pyridoxal 5'-phosphate synthase pdxT subunit